MRIIYNDIDKGAAAWLSQLGRTGALPRGRIITTSITELELGDVSKADQVHFFAGIGGWAHALELAGYAGLRCWTGSPPCQPFSVAGQQRGKDDDRHLAPVWLNLVRKCRPPVLFGEQVADAIRHGWLDDLFNALEECGYACGAAVLPACSVGAPHIRKRLFFGAVRLADSCGEPRKRLPGRFFAAEEREHRAGEQHGPLAIRHSDGGAANRLADSVPAGWPEWRPQSGERQAPRSRSVSRLAHSDQIQRGRVSDGEGGQPDRPQTGWNESHRFSEPDMPVGRLADTESHRRNGALRGNEREGVSETMGRGIADRMADPKAQRPPYGRERSVQPLFGESSGERSWLANTDNPRPQGRAGMPERSNEQPIGPGSVESRSADPYNSFWSGADWLGCRDGKFRPVESGTQPLVDGLPKGVVRGGIQSLEEQPGAARVMRLRGYGNAIVPALAAEFVRSFLASCEEVIPR